MTLALQEYLCTVCGKLDSYPFVAEPWHCGRVMERNRSQIRGADPIAISISLVEYVRGKVSREIGEWSGQENRIGKTIDDLQGEEFEPPEDWEPCFEVWCLRPARHNGERIAWLGRTALAWRYHMVKGVKNPDGAALTKELAVEAIWYAINS